MVITKEMDDALDGQARWIVTIVNKFCSIPANNWIDSEDFLGDFIIFYLQRRHKYDPLRGSQTKFVMILARSFCNKYVKKRRFMAMNVDAEKAVYTVELDNSERAFVESASRFLKVGRHSAESRMDSLASKMGIGRVECRDMLWSIAQKVDKKNTKMVLVHN
jgi:hypothetical protein